MEVYCIQDLAVLQGRPMSLQVESVSTEKYGVNTRSILRDLEVLESTGYPLVDEEDRSSPSCEKRWQGFNHLQPILITQDGNW
jgi:hypothetical protein